MMLPRAPLNAPRPIPVACANCRAKHLKCDAVTPTCGRCQNHGLACYYISSKRGSRAPPNPPPHVPVPAPVRPNGEFRPSWTRSSGFRGHGDYDARFSGILGFGSSVVVESPNQAVEYDPNGSSRASDVHAFLGSTRMEPYYSDLARDSRLDHYGNGGQPVTSFVPDHNSFNHTGNNYGSEQHYDNQYRATKLNGTPQGFRNDGDDYFVDLFYTHFYPAHPFLPPRRLLRQDMFQMPDHLHLVMVFIGHQFVQSASAPAARQRALEVVYGQFPEDAYRVQALLLLSLVFHARFEDDDCSAAMKKAVDLSLKLGMFDRSFAQRRGLGIPTLEESWRRTCWELFSLDVLLATFHPQRHRWRLQNIVTDHYLPCEEDDYAACRPGKSMATLADFRDQALKEKNNVFSSFAYKIEAVHLLQDVRRAENSTDTSEDSAKRSLDSRLTNFYLSLPPSKRASFNTDGSVDELLFSAYLIVNVASILYHHPQSSLASSRSQPAADRTTDDQTKISSVSEAQHTSRALKAADSISDSISAQFALSRHTSFLTSGIALASLVHLPAYKTLAMNNERPALRERLQLQFNALQIIGETWAIAKVVKAQVSKFAREVLFGSEPRSRLPTLTEAAEYMSPHTVLSDDLWLNEMSNTDFASGEGLPTDI